MTLHQLKIFSSVAKLLNVTKASAELHVSQPAVSLQLKLLQEEYGARLYEKNSRGIRLTEEGRAFLKDAEPILTQVNILRKKISNHLRDKKGSFLKVGASYTPSTSFLPLLLAVFKETHPHVHLTLRTDRSQVVEQLVLSFEVEIALITNPSYHPFLTYEPYRPMKIVAFVTAKHPLAKREQITLSELAQVPLVIRTDETPGKIRGTEELLKQLERKGLQPNIFMHCDSSLAVKAAVKSGVGVGVLYKETIEPELRKGELRILKIPELKIHFNNFIICPISKEKPLSSNAGDFLILLRQWPGEIRHLKDLPQVA